CHTQLQQVIHGRTLRYCDQPQLRPLDHLPDGPAIVQLCTAGRDWLQIWRGRARFCRRTARVSGGRPGSAGAHAYRYRGRGHRGSTAACLGAADPQGHRYAQSRQSERPGGIGRDAACTASGRDPAGDGCGPGGPEPLVSATLRRFALHSRRRSLNLYELLVTLSFEAAAHRLLVRRLGAAISALAGLLMTAALIFSWRYFESVGTLYHVLMLVFLTGMCGLGLTGDFFNLFVFFELMNTAGFALCGYKIEDAGSLQGALNFAVTNTIGAFAVLVGLSMLYARTGALNLAQMGRALSENPPDSLVIAALVMLSCGFLIKAAVVPFHFWLADAHAVAPTPVCVLFSGVMTELGLFAAARVFWTVMAGPFAAHRPALTGLWLTVGVLT